MSELGQCGFLKFISGSSQIGALCLRFARPEREISTYFSQHATFFAFPDIYSC
jgi:hypothetical protein